jgi:phenylalanyl-tRNA synthetase beta chain
MKISYSWLKDYINIEHTPEEICEILTQIGLEVAGMEEVESVKGGMKGLVVGKVITCEKHPNSDHLSKTTVDIGNNELLPIICGASNVAAGQKVVIATAGTTLYIGDQEFFLKKIKIRGEVSNGMICAEDEIGIGSDHEGIIVLDDSAEVGSPAKDYFDVDSDKVIEIDLTPNRIDGASHIGVARDLAAYLNQSGSTKYYRPSVDHFKVDNHDLHIPVEIMNPESCFRYAGISVSGVEVKESPDWLKKRLKVVGLTPINNLVDITNYVLFETGQPLHVFDANEIKGKKVIARTMPAGTRFITLDGEERILHEDDLMICNTIEPMAMAGIFGGIDSGVKNSTKNIFIESAWFNPVSVRKTARRHGLNTDASFRFERGTDPDGVIYALKRAALLSKELAGGTISSEIIDVYPCPAEDQKVNISYKNIARLIGKELKKETINSILNSLEIKIVNENDEGLSLSVPSYRVDVSREADVIEEILRIYGYNNIETPDQLKASLQYFEHPDRDELRNLVADILTGLGFNEIWSNSLTRAAYYDKLKKYKKQNTIKMLNPLSADLNGMRQTLLFGGLECIIYNVNRQNKDLKLYEFGNCYFRKDDNKKDDPVANYNEEEHLGLFLTGNAEPESWTGKQKETSLFQIKAVSENILKRLGLSVESMNITETENELLSEGLLYSLNNKTLLELGTVSTAIQQKFEIESPVYYADLNWEYIFTEHKKHKVLFGKLPKFPYVRRDLALLIDKDIKFADIKNLAFKIERKILREVGLFDVYEGKGVPQGKKSYAVSFILRDDSRTLKDNQIDKTMNKLVTAFKREFGAQLR